MFFNRIPKRFAHFNTSYKPDPAIERWVAFRDGYDHYFRWNSQNARYVFTRVVVFPVTLYYLFSWEDSRYDPWRDIRRDLNKKYMAS